MGGPHKNSKTNMHVCVCVCIELELSKAEVTLNEPHRPSPKAKATRSSTVRRHRKRATAHLRPQHPDEELSAVTTADDNEVIQRIKHVPGSNSYTSTEIVQDTCSVSAVTSVRVI